MSSADASSGDESMGQYAVPLAQEEPDACMPDDTTVDDIAERYMIPLHIPMDLAPPVPLQLANTDFQEPPPPHRSSGSELVWKCPAWPADGSLTHFRCTTPCFTACGWPRMCPSRVEQLRVMGRRLVNKRNGCCGGSLLSYTIGTLLTSGAGRQRPARGGSHVCLTHGPLLLKMNSLPRGWRMGMRGSVALGGCMTRTLSCCCVEREERPLGSA